MKGKTPPNTNLANLLTKLITAVTNHGQLSGLQFGKILREFPRDRHSAQPFFTKSQVLTAYLDYQKQQPLDPKLDAQIRKTLQVKPVRTQSGVATITVLTKPWPCPGQCIFCPSDIRMPKSYLADEPGAQRGELNFFDPYLQVKSRLANLAQMGHDLDKIELIVLGGTWDNYPLPYQIWFTTELFRALNERHLNSDSDEFREPGTTWPSKINPRRSTSTPTDVFALNSPESSVYMSLKRDSSEDNSGDFSGFERSGTTRPGKINTRRAASTPTDVFALNSPESAVDKPFKRDSLETMHNNKHAINQFNSDKSNTKSTHKSSIKMSTKITQDDEKTRIDRYISIGLSNNRDQNALLAQNNQKLVNNGQKTYNEIINAALRNPAQTALAAWQTTDWAELESEQTKNETAASRCVGLVIETRPDTITAQNLLKLRRLGCTKIQLGVQSVNDDILRATGRGITSATIARAFSLLRLFGFKIHAHFMANLPGATPASDIADYAKFVSDVRFLPDEVKIYPCSLIESAALMQNYHAATWQPYTEPELLQVLVSDLLVTPAYVRVTRMIRDISSHDIVVGNKKTNFRQLVEQEIARRGQAPQEIRAREIKNAPLDEAQLKLDDLIYETADTTEHFLHWCTRENQLAGFLRLSLPHADRSPFGAHVAMIREVHIYGRVAPLAGTANSQHLGLGKKLIEHAKKIATENGFTKLRVISAIGTREYYRKLGFIDDDLYQSLIL